MNSYYLLQSKDTSKLLHVHTHTDSAHPTYTRYALMVSMVCVASGVCLSSDVDMWIDKNIVRLYGHVSIQKVS